MQRLLKITTFVSFGQNLYLWSLTLKLNFLSPEPQGKTASFKIFFKNKDQTHYISWFVKINSLNTQSGWKKSSNPVP